MFTSVNPTRKLQATRKLHEEERLGGLLFDVIRQMHMAIKIQRQYDRYMFGKRANKVSFYVSLLTLNRRLYAQI